MSPKTASPVAKKRKVSPRTATKETVSEKENVSQESAAHETPRTVAEIPIPKKEKVSKDPNPKKRKVSPKIASKKLKHYNLDTINKNKNKLLK